MDKPGAAIKTEDGKMKPLSQDRTISTRNLIPGAKSGESDESYLKRIKQKKDKLIAKLKDKVEENKPKPKRKKADG